MFKSLASIFDKHDKKKCYSTERIKVDNALKLLNGFNETSYDDSARNVAAVDSDVSSAIISTCFKELSVDNYHDGSFDDAKSKTNIIGENKQMHVNGHKKKNILLSTQIQSLHCLFTWRSNSNSQNKRDIITYIKKKYGNYLDISLPEFTFVR